MTGDEIHCDTEGCIARLYLHHMADEAWAAAFARVSGWSVRSGSRRDYHYCPKHKEQT